MLRKLLVMSFASLLLSVCYIHAVPAEAIIALYNNESYKEARDLMQEVSEDYIKYLIKNSAITYSKSYNTLLETKEKNLEEIEEELVKQKDVIWETRDKSIDDIFVSYSKYSEIENRKKKRNKEIELLKENAPEDIAELEESFKEKLRQLKEEIKKADIGEMLLPRYPVEGYYFITSNYGYRPAPIQGAGTFHNGIDIGVDYNTKVYAAWKGVVTFAKVDEMGGNMIIINHGSGLETLYAHNNKLLVKVGDVVEQGELIALSGSTGYSTGPHLHFSVFINDLPVEPRKVCLDKRKENEQ